MTGFCETCQYRSEHEHCTNIKLGEDFYVSLTDDEKNDMLIYPYFDGSGRRLYDGGWFWVGPKFGCVHHKGKE